MLKVNHKNTSKNTTGTECGISIVNFEHIYGRCSGVLIVNFESISHLFLVFILLTLSK